MGAQYLDLAVHLPRSFKKWKGAFVIKLSTFVSEHNFSLTLSHRDPVRLASVWGGQMSGKHQNRPMDSSRRLGCQRASNRLLCWVLSPLWRLARLQHKQTKTWKNLSLWIQRQWCQSPLSLPTQVNSSKPILGQTLGSVPAFARCASPAMGGR